MELIIARQDCVAPESDADGVHGLRGGARPHGHVPQLAPVRVREVVDTCGVRITN